MSEQATSLESTEAAGTEINPQSSPVKSIFSWPKSIFVLDENANREFEDVVAARQQPQSTAVASPHDDVFEPTICLGDHEGLQQKHLETLQALSEINSFVGSSSNASTSD